MTVTLTEYPTQRDWIAVKKRALKTMGVEIKTLPDERWMRKILEARHSPIRRLHFSFTIENVPSWVSVHIVRHHVGIQPYVQSQRNDRQSEYDRNKAPQSNPVGMILDLNAESLMVLANKRLCMQASKETRELVQTMCDEVVKKCPEFEGLLVPMCEYHGGKCHEMKPCGRWE